MFVLGWLLPFFSNIVSQDFMHLVIDNYIVKGWVFVYSFCLTMLLYFRDEILACNNEEDIYVTLSVQNILAKGVPWRDIIESSANFPVTKKDIAVGTLSETTTVIY